MDELRNAIQAVRKMSPVKPVVGVVLGSGLGGLSEDIDNLQTVPFNQIPGFPHARVAGHAGNLLFGQLHGVQLVAMQGRVHYYEGHPMEKVVFGIRLMKLLGARTLITTNAVGAVNKSYEVGDLVMITDHINLLGDHPLRGPNDDELGPRFYDMSNAYDPKLREALKAVAQKLKIGLHEGIYAACMGPSYETPAEIRMLRSFGADTVGMSTVPEIQAGRHMDMRCLAVSLITNMAAGVLPQPLCHEEVIEASKNAGVKLRTLIKGLFQANPFDRV